MTQQAIPPTTSAPLTAMDQTDSLLTKWVDLYDQLEAARAVLKAPPAGASTNELKDDVKRLQRLAGAALVMVSAQQERERNERNS